MNELANFIGTPWHGERNCRWWTFTAFELCTGIRAPDALMQDTTDEALRLAAHASGFRRVHDAVRELDVLLMRRVQSGLRHVGLVIRNGSTLGLFHCEGGPDDPWPGVRWQPLPELDLYYKDFEPWRRTI